MFSKIFKDNFLTAFSSITSIAGLLMIFIVSVFSEPLKIDLQDVSAELIGKTITTSGYISSKNFHTNGHVFLTISEGKKKIQIPIFSQLANELKEKDFPFNSLRENIKLQITGNVDEYKGQLQIIPRKIDDVKIL